MSNVESRDANTGCVFEARERCEWERIVELCVVTFTAVVALNR